MSGRVRGKTGSNRVLSERHVALAGKAETSHGERDARRGPCIRRADLPQPQRLGCALGPLGSPKPISMRAPTCHTTLPAHGSPRTAAPLTPSFAPPHRRWGIRLAASQWRIGLLRRRHPHPAPSRSSSTEVHAPFPLLLHPSRHRLRHWWIPA
ncbi:hypothetical protein PVAP13_7KG213210 [Panicum virgatum]|uniref:Uncharacterized protein n=1 Tax=Panicum virgatum TaxID=38727 RepID=A0A8T0QCZ8_PANVG|nr:hypothetical protein PVAP13_7KG213210 [Panicum virgatum]KAG2572958.1 hypothetical protein PVAP13_7KG213210 [Panicum virgatum]KAG2572959.1 hypothetical protein PVAP13_7KG213210 [Panicum virgatum]